MTDTNRPLDFTARLAGGNPVADSHMVDSHLMESLADGHGLSAALALAPRLEDDELEDIAAALEWFGGVETSASREAAQATLRPGTLAGRPDVSYEERGGCMILRPDFGANQRLRP